MNFIEVYKELPKRNVTVKVLLSNNLLTEGYYYSNYSKNGWRILNDNLFVNLADNIKVIKWSY